MALEKLRASLAVAPVVQFGEYPYFIHPITDGVPTADPELLRETVDAMAAIGDWRCDKIVTAEAMGFPLAAALAMKVGRPYVFIRKRKYSLPGETTVHQQTGYSGAQLYVNDIHRGDRVVFVDDVVSTGGTLRAVVHALRGLGAVITDIVVVFDKARDKAALERELAVTIKTLLRVEVRAGTLVERP